MCIDRFAIKSYYIDNYQHDVQKNMVAMVVTMGEALAYLHTQPMR